MKPIIIRTRKPAGVTCPALPRALVDGGQERILKRIRRDVVMDFRWFDLQALRAARMSPADSNEVFPHKANTSVTATPAGFMFADIQQAARNRLPTDERVTPALRAMGAAMMDTASHACAAVGGMPAIYAYFARFVGHDVAHNCYHPQLKAGSIVDPLDVAHVQPIASEAVPRSVFNGRDGLLNLDCVYGGDAVESIMPSGRLRLGRVSANGVVPPIETADPYHDLLRTLSQGEQLNRRALIGDARNDTDLIISQLHVAFVRAHNALIGRRLSYNEARTAMTRRYQAAVLYDLLPRICDLDVLSDIAVHGPRFIEPMSFASLFIPLEFSHACLDALRPMRRERYSYNSHFNPQATPATRSLLGTSFVLSAPFHPTPGPMSEFTPLPDSMPIEWHRFFDTPSAPASQNPAGLLRCSMSHDEAEVTNTAMGPAARVLLRAHLVALPCGQAIARHIGADVLDEGALTRDMPDHVIAQARRAGLLERSPLWYYLLAEAATLQQGRRLGPVGSRIFAETMWRLIEQSPSNILSERLAAVETETGEFSLRGIVRMGQDKAMRPV